MRKYAELSLIVALSLLAIPLFAGLGREKLPPLQNISLKNISGIINDIETDLTDIHNDQAVTQDSVSVKKVTTGENFEVSLLDYVMGVVACEMPMYYEDEALKAQAVACRTYLSYYNQNNAGKAIPTSAQGFLTTDEMKIRWGDDFDSHYARLQRLVELVENEIITYDGKPILAAYHAISGGETENSCNVWGEEMPCLAPVDSSFDKFADGYKTGVDVSRDQFAKTARNSFSIDIGSTPIDQFITDINRSASGTVLRAKICGTEVSGASIRSAFSLRSANFDVSVIGDRLFFVVRGYGHGVGMSQNGANEMAKNGSDYKEILEHYYPGSQIITQSI